jgi:pimeloyl-ACP methyl ester carboxylesterase
VKPIYCISGLGADERIFKKLHINGHELKHISWPEFDRYDELPCYAQKVSVLIPDENPIILGLSFGGMLAVEIGKMRPVKQLILISSAKTANELTKFGGLLRKLIVTQVLPAFIYKMPSDRMYDMFSAQTEEDKELLRGILKDSDGQFMRWAMKAVTLWRNQTYPEPIMHIHGTADKIIPAQPVLPDHWIEGGGHMMVYNRADEINAILNKELNP